MVMEQTKSNVAIRVIRCIVFASFFGINECYIASCETVSEMVTNPSYLKNSALSLFIWPIFHLAFACTNKRERRYSAFLWISNGGKI